MPGGVSRQRAATSKVEVSQNSQFALDAAATALAGSVAAAWAVAMFALAAIAIALAVMSARRASDVLVLAR